MHWNDSSGQTAKMKIKMQRTLAKTFTLWKSLAKDSFLVQGKQIYLVILQQWSNVTELLLLLCMISINQIPHLTMNTMHLWLSSFFCDCFYLPPSSARLLSEILSTSLSLLPLTLQSVPVLDLLPPPSISHSASLKCIHLLAQSFTHLSYFSFSPTLFTYDLPGVCMSAVNPNTISKQEDPLLTIRY